MLSSRISLVKGDGWRRVYVFLAVSLAAFVLAIAAMCVTGGLSRPATQIATASQMTEARAAILAANNEYADSRRATQAALEEFEQADAEFLEFLYTHFSELIDTQAALAPEPDSTGVTQDSTGVDAATSIVSPDENTAGSTEPESAKSQSHAKSPWGSLSEQLAKLKEYRQRLLESLQPSHPSIGAVDLAISDVESQLRKSPPEETAPLDSSPDNNGPQDSVTESPPQEPPKTDSTAPVIAGAPDASGSPADRAARLERWQKADARFRELADEVNDARTEYHGALAREKVAWQHQVQTLAENPSALSLGSDSPSPTNTRRILEVCGWLAVGLGLSVSIWARRSERVFQNEAEVRQALDLVVLGVLPRAADMAPRERPQGEPRWVGTAVRSSEIWLVAVVALLAVVTLADHQFLTKLIADPLAACSGKFWC